MCCVRFTMSPSYRKEVVHCRTLVLSSLAMCSERLSHRILSLESATHPEGASDA
jgi:hypothetical protein